LPSIVIGYQKWECKRENKGRKRVTRRRMEERKKEKKEFILKV
jgi:hypothetical protein